MSVSNQFSRASWSGPRRWRQRGARGRAARFAPGLWPTVLALLGMAVLLGLGTWQLDRLHWKEALIAERQARFAVSPAPLPASAEDWGSWNFRPVVVEGAFRHDLEQLFGVAALDGQVGHHVLTPLVRQDGAAVLVERGWVPADRAHAAVPRSEQTAAPGEVTGIARFRGDDRPGWFTPDNRPDQGLWYWYDLRALQGALGLELLPVVIEADATSDPGGPPTGEQTRAELPNDHLLYAITWYGLAAGLLVVWISFGFARGRQA